MPPQNSQVPPTDQPSALGPDDHAANLALATHISTQLAAPEQPPEGPETPLQTMQDTHGSDMAQQVEELQKQVADLTKKVAQEPKDDIAEMRQMIEQALGEDEPNDGKQS